MKVVLLAPEFATTDGGIQRILRLYLTALASDAAHTRIELVTLNDTAAELARLPVTSARQILGKPLQVTGCGGSKITFTRAAWLAGSGAHRLVCGHIGQLPVAALAARRGCALALVAHGIEVWEPTAPLYKLRTMHSFSEGEHYTAKADKRITRIGTILRAFRLDELPQLWNVLKGDMSMIGPRAEWDVLVRGYEREIPCYHFRHLVRPGITGWAQINYPYGAGIDDTLRKLEYDLFYIRHYSFQIDASIVLKTVHVMLFDKGSR